MLENILLRCMNFVKKRGSCFVWGLREISNIIEDWYRKNGIIEKRKVKIWKEGSREGDKQWKCWDFGK